MAWMSSNSTSGWWLTGEFTVYRISEYEDARLISDMLGFNSEKIDHAGVKAEVVRVETNRAQLIKEIADAILPAIAAGATVTADVDEAAIARAVEAQLVDEFAVVNTNINRPRTVS